MKQLKPSHSKGIGALELIEESVSLLRRAPLEALARYYVGTLPFMLGILYFWADMSRNTDANDHLAGASLGLALLFVWMKFWQSRFCGNLSRVVLENSLEIPKVDTALGQVIFQPWSMFALPLALLITLPFGWCFAFFQNITVLGGSTDLRRLYKTARQQALLWQSQNHVLILVFFLLSLVIFANLCISAFFFPRMLKTLFGVESFFTRSNLFLLNSTFWAAMAVLTHICIDPLIKAAYLLRCHYGESLASGADLLAELKESRSAHASGLLMLILTATLLMAAAQPVMATEIGQSASSRTVSVQKLDKTIEQVLRQPEFAWRLPSSAAQKAEMPGFIRSAIDQLKEWAVGLGHLIKRFLEWLADIVPKFKPKKGGSTAGRGFPDYVFPLMYGLLALCLSVGAVLLWRQVRRRCDIDVETAPSQIVIGPDISDENVMADELSEERWRALAKELLNNGELRLGLRALYLACLACLAQEHLIAIARFKSNCDYERELGRFSHTMPAVAESFSSNRIIFERAWYGVHAPEQGTVEIFMANFERIVSSVRQG